ncbi:MAG: hypothetical protein SFV15_13880 [Polyangiaceae bacterium]|nr:hypothetical protein [Polyangiaceae bacterium]
MTNKLLAAATLGWLLSGCSLLQGASGAATPGTKNLAKASHAKVSKAEARPVGDGRVARRVGDYFVSRFSGTFREQPLELKEAVLSSDAKAVVVEYALQDGDKSTTLRVYRNPKTDAVEKVLAVEGKSERPSTLAAFEELLAQTVFAADSNEGLVDAKKSTCLVGTDEHACESKEYAVFVGEKMATMVVTSSRELPGRDIGGEIKTEDGDILYRSELIETGHNAGKAATASLDAK